MFLVSILFLMPTKAVCEDDYVEDAYTNDFDGNDNEVEYEYEGL